MDLQNVIRTVPVYKDSIKRGEVRILVNTNQASKKPFRTQAVLASSSSSSGPSSTVTSSSLNEKDSDQSRSRPSTVGTPIPCKRSFPPLLATLAATSSPSPPKSAGNSIILPYCGNNHTITTYDVSSYASGSGTHTLASLTARSTPSNSSRSKQNYQNQHQIESDSSEMTPNSKAKHRYETSLGQLTKKFICLLKEAPEGVSFLYLRC